MVHSGPVSERNVAVMKRYPQVPDEEKELFRQAVSDVRPLRTDTVQAHQPRPAPIPYKRLEDESRVLDDLFSDPPDPSEVETGEELFFSRSGLQHGVIRKLRRGHYAVGAELDLHGMTVVEARAALTEFLHTAQSRQIRCVRIVHGKGNGSMNRLPVLKGKVNHWLRQRDEILAFSSARQVDGGTGAVYVLLRRPR